MTPHDAIRRHLLKDLFLDALPERSSLEYVERYQVTVERFETLRRNRMKFGWFRYRHNFNNPGPGSFDAVSSAIARLEKYKATGNQEHLVDAANLCAVEFHLPTHPNSHFESIDDGQHTGEL